jgi:hypothetical protein
MFDCISSWPGCRIQIRISVPVFVVGGDKNGHYTWKTTFSTSTSTYKVRQQKKSDADSAGTCPCDTKSWRRKNLSQRQVFQISTERGIKLSEDDESLLR